MILTIEFVTHTIQHMSTPLLADIMEILTMVVATMEGTPQALTEVPTTLHHSTVTP